MTALSDFRTLMLNILGDSSGSRYDTTTLDACLRSALREYTQASPNISSSTITLTAPGREISLATVTGLLSILEITYPYTTANTSPQPYPSWYLFTKAGAKTLYLTGGRLPASGEKIRILYSALHTITSLDSASSTTVPAAHENNLAAGAAAFAAYTRAASLNEAFGTRKDEFKNLLSWGTAMLESFRAWLRTLTNQVSGFPFPPSAWTLDQDDLRPHLAGTFDRDFSS